MANGDGPDELDIEVPGELPGSVREPTIAGLPAGFLYGVTRYADVILQQAFPGHLDDLVTALEGFDAQLGELQAGGGNRAPFVVRFDASLGQRGWGERSIEIAKTIDGEPIARVRGHKIDMFKVGAEDDPYPGVAVEMEWSNKDPFFDRDLLNFQALHREGALAVGVIVTRGPDLQRLIKPIVLNRRGQQKYGESSTHWNKLVPRVNLGGGGECPLLLVGIQPERIGGFDVVHEVWDRLEAAEAALRDWRGVYANYQAARAAHADARRAAFELLPPPVNEDGDDQ